MAATVLASFVLRVRRESLLDVCFMCSKCNSYVWWSNHVPGFPSCLLVGEYAVADD